MTDTGYGQPVVQGWVAQEWAWRKRRRVWIALLVIGYFGYFFGVSAIAHWVEYQHPFRWSCVFVEGLPFSLRNVQGKFPLLDIALWVHPWVLIGWLVAMAWFWLSGSRKIYSDYRCPACEGPIYPDWRFWLTPSALLSWARWKKEFDPDVCPHCQVVLVPRNAK